MNDFTSHFPQFGQLLPDGRLRIPTSERTEDGEIRDGFIEIGQEHPRYDEWTLAIQQKDQYLKDLKDRANAARELRRKSRHQG